MCTYLAKIIFKKYIKILILLIMFLIVSHINFLVPFHWNENIFILDCLVIISVLLGASF